MWKHLWGKAGKYLCGLNDDDMRRVAIDLRLTIRDMQVMADEQSDKMDQRIWADFEARIVSPELEKLLQAQDGVEVKASDET